MARTIRINFIYNFLNTVVGLLFPLIIVPYTSRVLMPEGIGIVQFLQSIVSYVTLLTSIGIPLYGVREIAKIRDDIEERNKTTIEILVLHAILSIIGYAFIFILGFGINRITENLPIFLVLSLHVVLNALGATWFYQAIEDFKYITIRSLVVRFVCLCALFIFVKDSSDLFAYACVLVLAEVGNNLFNFIHLRKFITTPINRIAYKELRVRRHIKPACRIFLLNIITSIYVNLDTVMLGFLTDNSSVGFYASASKISKVLLGVVTTLGSVLLPRFSNLVSSRQTELFENLSKKAYDVIITFAMPGTVMCIICARIIMLILCGQLFADAILTLQILSPIILFIGLSNYIGLQILYPQNKEAIVIKCTAIGAVVNFLLNLILIPKLSQNGAAIATVVAEGLVTGSMFFIGRKYIPFRPFNKNFISVVIGCVGFSFPVCYVNSLNLNIYFTAAIDCIIAVVIYCAVMLIMRNQIFSEIIHTSFSKNNM